MECKALSQEANNLFGQFDYSHPVNIERQSKISSKFICGALHTEIRVTSSRCILMNYNDRYGHYYLEVSVRFHKLLENDNFIYKCEIESSSSDELVKELRICDDHWYPILSIHQYNVSTGVVWKKSFDLTLKCEISRFECVFSSLYDDTQSTDFKLCGLDGSVQIHKTILSAFSPVLRTMLAGEWKETQEGRVALPGVSVHTLQNLKDYMYLNKLPETGLQELCVLAAYYMIPKLVTSCYAELLNKLSNGNFLQISEFAVTNHLGSLYIALLKTVRETTPKIPLDKLTLKNEWLEVSDENNTIEKEDEGKDEGKNNTTKKEDERKDEEKESP